MRTSLFLLGFLLMLFGIGGFCCAHALSFHKKSLAALAVFIGVLLVFGGFVLMLANTAPATHNF